jgi:hypothetical protein
MPFLPRLRRNKGPSELSGQNGGGTGDFSEQEGEDVGEDDVGV